MMHIQNTQRGMTLVELLVASTLGILVSTAVAGFFLQSKQSFAQNDEISFLQDNGRYALKALSTDIEMADYWGGLTSPGVIDTTDSSIAISGTECGSTGWTYNTAAAIAYLSAPSASAATTEFPCMSSFDSGTDILVVKRVRGLEYSTTANALPANNNKIYLRTNRTTAYFFRNTGTPTAYLTGEADWEYRPYLYYVENAQLKRKMVKWNGTSSLLQISNDATAAAMDDVLAEGIEQFHVMFGIDSDGDEVADFFVSGPTAAQLATAVMARIYVLARSQKEISGYTNDKSFRLGDRVVAAANDGYYRKVYSSSVMLRDSTAIRRFS